MGRITETLASGWKSLLSYFGKSPTTRSPEPVSTVSTPSQVRIHRHGYAINNYAGGIPWGDVVLANAHSYASRGLTVVSEGESRTIAGVTRVNIPGISASNGAGDIVILRLDSPFPPSVTRATLATSTAGGLLVQHQDGSFSKRTRVLRPDGQPDSRNPRWLMLAMVGGKPIIGGDSGGAILRKKDHRVVGIISRSAEGQGLNLAHADVQKALRDALNS